VERSDTHHHDWDGTDRSRAKRRGITAPRYTLLKRGQLGEFSLDALVVLAVHAGLSIGLTNRTSGGVIAPGQQDYEG